MDDALARVVRERAGFACEYCRLLQPRVRVPFHVDHVIPRQHGGPTTPGNLAYACLFCNLHKGPNLTGLDRVAGRSRVVRLFNPRRQVWGDHFAWDGPRIVGKSPVGRVTVGVLDLNAPAMVGFRAMLITEGAYPPPG